MDGSAPAWVAVRACISIGSRAAARGAAVRPPGRPVRCVPRGGKKRVGNLERPACRPSLALPECLAAPIIPCWFVLAACQAARGGCCAPVRALPRPGLGTVLLTGTSYGQHAAQKRD